jgi:Zn-dependent protease with chaperone function
MHRTTGWLLSILFVVVMAPAISGAEDRARSPYDRAVARAIAQLPRHPIQVVVIDANEARPGVRETLLKLDAFITDGGKVVYLVKQSTVLQQATEGSHLADYMLASIIWHEMAHVDGADERAARRAEEELWTRFVRDGILDQVTALRYLDALTKRPDDRLMASR